MLGANELKKAGFVESNNRVCRGVCTMGVQVVLSGTICTSPVANAVLTQSPRHH